MPRGAETLRSVRLPGCKSLSARALLLAACAEGKSRLSGLSDSEDTQGLIAALEDLGVGVRRGPEEGVLWLRGWSGPPQARGVTADVGEAGSSLRFLLPLLAAGRTEVTLRGAARLFARPHGPLLDFLAEHGAHVEPVPADERGRPGLRVHGTGLAGGEWRPPLAQSSQYLSGLLMAAGWSGGVRIVLDGPLPSAGYVDLTLEALRAFRGPTAVRPVHEGFLVAPGEVRPIEYDIPGDPSGATFFLVALVLRGGKARFREPWSAVHPEARLARTFFDEGLLRADASGVEATGECPAAPVEFDLEPAPDAGPALAVLGAELPHGVRLRRVGRLRFKESDRVQGILRLLQALGHAGRLDGDDLVVEGGGLRDEELAPGAAAGGGFDPDGDHRLAMAAGIAALKVPRLAVRDADCVAKSFPRFWEERESWLAP